ncbi:MAG: cytochrome c3 family protein [Myxococcales bacterium]|nr:cytochrome c3 family protein [Myxococcales bacterium]
MRSRRLLAWGVLAVGLAACAGVLGLRRTASPAFPHRAHVTKGVPCVTCHVAIAEAGDTGPLHLPDDDKCLTCHSPPHEEGSCLSCHTDPATAPAVMESRAHLLFTHQAHKAPARGECVICHRAVAEGDTHLRPVMATCFRCHDDRQDARNCNACHVDLAEEGTLPSSHLAHDGDWVREHGARAASAGDLCASCHAQRFCASCHGQTTAALPAQLAFDDPGRASVHRAGFASRHDIEARADPGACATCHSPSTCETCHTDNGVAAVTEGPRLNPHPAGWVSLVAGDNEHGRAARRDPAACAACHGGAGESLCVGCHKVGGVGGNPHPAGWSSRQSLAEQPCRLCHISGP